MADDVAAALAPARPREVDEARKVRHPAPPAAASWLVADARPGSDSPSRPAARPPSQSSALVSLHVYHVSQNNVVRRLNRITGGSRNPLKFGGVFHAGIEVGGREWSFGATLDPADTGVAWNVPKKHSMHQFYSTVELGETKLGPSDVHAVIARLAKQWPGGDYDMIHHNCCHFADVLAVELGMGHIPRWVNRFARTADRAERAKESTKEGISVLKKGLRNLFIHHRLSDPACPQPSVGGDDDEQDDDAPTLACKLPPRPATPPGTKSRSVSPHRQSAGVDVLAPLVDAVEGEQWT